MRDWDLVLAPAEEATPLYARIARAVADDVLRGRLRPGDALPGSRTLAQSLGVHRNTVVAAYRELEAQGFIASAPARGVFVSEALPPPPRRFAAPVEKLAARAGFDLPDAVDELPAPPRRGELRLAGGVPDLRLAPLAALARAYRRAIKRHGATLLDYGDPRGVPALRAAIAAMLSAARGLAVGADDVLVVRGSQMALYLVAQTLCAPGDVVAVEALGYRPAWAAFRRAGVRLAPLPVDEGGLRVDALAQLIEKTRVRAVYVTPHHQLPSTVTLAAGRRLRLLELARAHRVAVIEDDFDHEFHYDGRPVLPLASADRAGVVVYIGTLSKVLAPGLRLGFLVAPRPVLERAAALRTVIDRQGDFAVEAAVAELLEEGEVQRYVRRSRRIYLARRDALAEALAETLDGAVSFQVPNGGMAFWAHVDPAIDVAAWADRAFARGVVFNPGWRFDYDERPIARARFGFAALREPELREAVRRIAGCLPKRRR